MKKTAVKTVLSMITGDVYGGESLRYTFTDDAGRVNLKDLLTSEVIMVDVLLR